MALSLAFANASSWTWRLFLQSVNRRYLSYSGSTLLLQKVRSPRDFRLQLLLIAERATDSRDQYRSVCCNSDFSRQGRSIRPCGSVRPACTRASSTLLVRTSTFADLGAQTAGRNMLALVRPKSGLKDPCFMYPLFVRKPKLPIWLLFATVYSKILAPECKPSQCQIVNKISPRYPLFQAKTKALRACAQGRAFKT